MVKVRQLLRGKLAQNALWMILAKAYQMLVNLVVSMIMARYLGPSNYGLINYAGSFASLFASICSLGLGGILIHELISGEEKGELMGSAIGMKLLSGVFSVVTITALAFVLNPDEPLTVTVVLIYSTTLIFRCFDVINLWHQANLNSHITAIISTAGYTIAAIYKIVLLLTQKDVRWFAASHAVEYALVAALLLLSYCPKGRNNQKLHFSFQTGKALCKKSYHYILSGLMVSVYGQMDRIMLKYMLGETSVGYYSAALTICSMWPFVVAAITDASRPVILVQHKSDVVQYEKSLIRLYGVIIYVSVAAALGISVFSKLIIWLLYGEAYYQAQGVLCIMCWYTIFSQLGVARSIWIVPNGKQKYEKYIAASGAVCNLVLNALMIPAWGVNGAAIATLVTQVFTNFIVGFFIREIRPNNILILKAFRFWRYLK